MARLLLVEDDARIGEVLSSNLNAHGHEVRWLQTGRAALQEADSVEFDLILLDLGLPDLDGIAVCRQLRATLPAAVLVMITARTAEVDVVLGLEAGADDYLTKPLRMTELLARIHAHLRRGGHGSAVQTVVPLGDLVVDTGARRVTVAGEDLQLRAKEFDLLARLAAEPDAAIARATLMADVWDAHWFGPTKTLDVHVASLRRRLAAFGEYASVPEIVTVRGHGYRLETPRSSVAHDPLP